MLLAADAGQIAVGLLVAALGFLVVCVVCATLLAIFQRVLPAPRTPDGEDAGLNDEQTTEPVEP